MVKDPVTGADECMRSDTSMEVMDHQLGVQHSAGRIHVQSLRCSRELWNCGICLAETSSPPIPKIPNASETIQMLAMKWRSNDGIHVVAL